MDGVPIDLLPSRKWLGVIEPESDGSTLTGVNGRAFSACSTRQKVVFNTSSVSRRVPMMVYSTLLKLRTNSPRFHLGSAHWVIEPPHNALMFKFGGD